MSRAYTKDEMREEFLEQIRILVNYWGGDSDNKVKEKTSKEKLDGLAFSILNIFDGSTVLPAFDIVVRPHKDDKKYNIERGEKYYEDGICFNDDVILHELWSMKK